jgi:hypothetical protein
MRRALAVAVGLLLAAAYPAAASAATFGHWALDETSGNTVVDSSGFHNDGTDFFHGTLDDVEIDIG